jgi:hypothetical protein
MSYSRVGQKHGLKFAELMEALKAEPQRELIAADGSAWLRATTRHSTQVQRRAFEAARSKDLIEFVDYACKPVYGKPSGGRWRLKVSPLPVDMKPHVG